MVLALVLAQLVLPGPPSEPLSPPGMICMGECSDGPMVWRASPARGRLVVACDMTSDTCSDGRRIVTERATPVPCEVSPGVWEMVPEDTACISYRGLESWASTTSYLSFGAELDRSPWSALRGGTIEALTDGYRVTSAAGEAGVSGRIQVLSAQPEEGPVTLSCIVRTQQPIGRLTLEAGTGVARHFAPFDTAGKWERVSVSGAIAAGAARWAGVGPRNTDLTPASVDVKACWYTYTSTPGRACWGGEAPVTCARDLHRLPATGFPATTGEISWVMRLERVPDGTSALRGIIWADGAPVPNRLSLTEGGAIRVYTGETAYATEPLSWEPGRSYTIKLIMDEDEWRVVRDGALVGSTPPLGSMDWRATVRLGELLDGSISSLRIRSFE